IIPLPLYNPLPAGSNPGVEVDPTDASAVRAALEQHMRMNLTGASSPVSIAPDSAALQFTVTNPASAADTGYITVNYKYNLGQLDMDQPYSYTMVAPNTTQLSTSLATRFTLRDGNKAFIAGINYLAGYESDMTESQLFALEG